MNKELIQQQSYNEIVTNQIQILQQLDKTNLMVSNVNDLSNRFINDAFMHFKQGSEAIARIRANLDQIHKSVQVVKKYQQNENQKGSQL